MKKAMLYITNILIIMGLFLGSIYYVTFDKAFYEDQYKANDTAKNIGMSHQDLTKSTEVLLKYLKDEVPTLEVAATVNGQERQVFDQREKEHMVDVKNLFRVLKISLWTFLILAVVVIVYIILISKKEGIRNLGGVFIPTAFVFFAVIVALGGIFLWNFNWFWTNFHLLIFSNDLWLLDPEVSIMINMFPLEFFYGCCFRILTIFTGEMVLLGLLSIFLKNKFKNI